MNNLVKYILNFLFFGVVILIAFSVATIALTKKVNEYRSTQSKGVKATVVKQVIPVLSFTRGYIKKLPVKIGEPVSKNSLLVQLDNPPLKSKIEALQNYPDNISAQTEAKVAQEELKNLNILSPVDGVIGEILVTEGSPVDNLSKIMTIYSNDDIKILADLNLEQNQLIQKKSQLKAYNKRLNQTFLLKPDLLRPDVKSQYNLEEKKIGVYFTLVNKDEGSSLLHNEDLELDLEGEENQVKKPIDFFVDFWNGLLAKQDTEQTFKK